MRLAPVLRGLVAGVLFWPLAATAAPLGVSVKTDGPNDFTVTVAIDAERLPVTHASAFGLTFTQIRAGDPKAIRQPGLPDLPEFHRLVAVDPTQKYEVQTTLEGKVVYDNVLLMPEQEDTPDNGTKAAFRLDSESYKIDRELGSVTVMVGALAHIGPISVMPLTLTPFHYNPAKRQLTVWRHVTAHAA